MNRKPYIRLISLLLCFVMLVGLLPATAFASEEVTVKTYNDLWRAFSSSGYSSIVLDNDITYSVPEGGNTPLQPYQFLLTTSGDSSKTLDLNGHTLQVTNERTAWPTQSALFTLYGKSSITVMNGTIKLYNYNTSARTDQGVFNACDESCLSLSNVEVFNGRNGTAINAQNDATLTIESGTVTASGGFAVTATGNSWLILDKGTTLTTHDGSGLVTQFNNAGYGSLHSETPNLTIRSAMLNAGVEVAESTIGQFAPLVNRLVFAEGKQYDSAFATSISGDHYWDTEATGGCALISNTGSYSFTKNLQIISTTSQQTVTVFSGTASPNRATYGTTVTVTPDPQPGKVFYKWDVVSGNVYLADPYAETTTFTMGAQPVVIEASYRNAPIASAEFSVALPVQGGHPSSATSNTDHITVSEVWCAEKYSDVSFGNTLPEDAILLGGHTYRIGITIDVADGYTLSDSFSVQFVDPVSKQTFTASQGATRYMWYVDYLVEDHSVEISSASATISGVEAYATAGSAKVTTKDTTYTVSIQGWYDCDNVFNWSSAPVLKASDTFVGGKTYTVGVIFTPVDFNTLASSMAANINGETGMIGSWDFSSRVFYITVTVPPHSCTLKRVAKVAPTCTKAGKKAYYKCQGCGKCFEDALGSTLIPKISAWGKLNALGHSYASTYTLDKPATRTADGSRSKHCTRSGCTAKTGVTAISRIASITLNKATVTFNGKVQKPTVVVKDAKGKTVSASNYTVTYPSGMKNAGTYSIKVTLKGNYSGSKTLTYKIKPINISQCTVKLSAKAYTYNGKVKTPVVTVKNASGTTLKKGTHYTVTYASGRKNVGTYKVTVTMKGNYTGSKTLTFKINPPKTTVKKLTAGVKKLTVKITKKVSQVTGYQIQYATNKSFSSAKTKTITSYKTLSATLTGLIANQTYYVRVRTYKTVNGVKYYSGWSVYKTAKTK